ncbi:hypothetical protein FA15DRAFT_709681 [Coprinopsis marcescibilis]|uniref:CFEM domain-containing protein n=1 Tax=Coprinopsis marcescibilis TaxID=230819 RepID=A0A5C3KEW7_COPMA|nr:hypothetical protein FA15DRAFT_709681 [Coprinopsis marcescibilis]
MLILKTVFPLAALATLVLAQDMSQCSAGCAKAAIEATGGCTAEDTACLCGNAQYPIDILGCLRDTCNHDESVLQATKEQLVKACAAVSVTPSGTTGPARTFTGIPTNTAVLKSGASNLMIQAELAIVAVGAAALIGLGL